MDTHRTSNWLYLLLCLFISTSYGITFAYESSHTLGWWLGWIAFAPAVLLSLGIAGSTLLASLRTEQSVLLPNYDTLENLKRIQKNGLRTALLLPFLGGLQLLVLLPGQFQKEFAFGAFGLPEALLHSTGVLQLPSLESPALGIVFTLVLYICVRFFSGQQRRFAHIFGTLLVVALLLWLDPMVMLALIHSKHSALRILSMLILGIVVYFVEMWLIKTYLPALVSNVLERYTVMWVFPLVGCIAHHAELHTLPSKLGSVTVCLGGLGLLVLSLHNTQTLKALSKEALFLEMHGSKAYIWGALWPLFLLCAWYGWLFIGGTRFHSPLQYSVTPFVLLIWMYFLCFWSFSTLQMLHTTALNPPNRLWLFVRPFIIYLVLFVLFGLPGLAIIKSVRW